MALDDGVNGMFYLSILTLICGSFGLTIRYCYRLKCKELSCCCIKILRDIETEKIENLEKQTQVNESTENYTKVNI
jgi:hypothetical protein